MLFTMRGCSFTSETEIRAAIRTAHLIQCGQWMMGSVNLWGHTITLSGTYGEDGLTNDCASDELWAMLHPLPPEVARAFWADGTGHNSAGHFSGPLIHDWAINREAQLRRKYTALNPHLCARCLRETIYTSKPIRCGGRRYCVGCFVGANPRKEARDGRRVA
jgi:hypothetical protein